MESRFQSLSIELGFWILDSGFWILDSGFWILDSGFRIPDSLPTFTLVSGSAVQPPLCWLDISVWVAQTILLFVYWWSFRAFTQGHKSIIVIIKQQKFWEHYHNSKKLNKRILNVPPTDSVTLIIMAVHSVTFSHVRSDIFLSTESKKLYPEKKKLLSQTKAERWWPVINLLGVNLPVGQK